MWHLKVLNTRKHSRASPIGSCTASERLPQITSILPSEVKPSTTKVVKEISSSPPPPQSIAKHLNAYESRLHREAMRSGSSGSLAHGSVAAFLRSVSVTSLTPSSHDSPR